MSPKRKAPEAPEGPLALHKATQYHRRWKRAQWRGCRHEFWVHEPGPMYTFTADQCRAMRKLLTEDEVEYIKEAREELDSFKEIAHKLKVPWFMIQQQFTDKSDPAEFKKLKTRREGLSDLERLKRLESAMITEMEERVSKKETREEISHGELVSMTKMIAQTITSLETGSGGEGLEGVRFQVVTNMPKKKMKKDFSKFPPLEMGEQR